jgi:hypothetical protein
LVAFAMRFIFFFADMPRVFRTPAFGFFFAMCGYVSG